MYFRVLWTYRLFEQVEGKRVEPEDRQKVNFQEDRVHQYVRVAMGNCQQQRYHGYQGNVHLLLAFFS